MEPAATPSAHPRVDWTALHQRADAAQARLDETISPTGERRRALLRERARLAARESAPAEPPASRLELVEFTLLHETYGVEASYVREVAHLEHYLPLPGAPTFILGVVPLRGRMLTVVNLKPFFELPEQGLTNLNKIIVLVDGPLEFGLLADSVSGGLRRVPARDLQAPPPSFTGLRARFSRGLAPNSVIVLDAPRLLHDPRFDTETPDRSQFINTTTRLSP